MDYIQQCNIINHRIYPFTVGYYQKTDAVNKYGISHIFILTKKHEQCYQEPMNAHNHFRYDFVYGSFLSHKLYDGGNFDLESGPWIAGGFVREYGMDENCRDIDVYFKNPEQLQKFIEIQKPYPAINDRLLDLKLTMLGKFNIVSFIFFDNPYNVIRSIDFTCCAGVSDGKNFIAHGDMFQAINEKRLTFTHYQNVKTKLNRFKKYLTYGYTPDQEVVRQVFCLDDWKDHIVGNEFIEAKNQFNS